LETERATTPKSQQEEENAWDEVNRRPRLILD